jgi:hypothetical protein
VPVIIAVRNRGFRESIRGCQVEADQRLAHRAKVLKNSDVDGKAKREKKRQRRKQLPVTTQRAHIIGHKNIFTRRIIDAVTSREHTAATEYSMHGSAGSRWRLVINTRSGLLMQQYVLHQHVWSGIFYGGV